MLINANPAGGDRGARQGSLHSGRNVLPATNSHLHTSTQAAPAIGLFYGNAKNPLIRIALDDCCPHLWRILSPDGLISDITNLSRAKDAAVAACENDPHRRRDPRRFHRLQMDGGCPS
jgi:hypothetical protein